MESRAVMNPGSALVWSVLSHAMCLSLLLLLQGYCSPNGVSAPIHLPKIPTPNAITLEVKALTYKSEGNGHKHPV